MENDEEKNFFKFLAGHEAENDLTKTIDEKVNFAKLNMEWKKIYMTWQQTIDEEKDIAFEEGVRQGMECGIEQGIYKKSVEDALVLIRNYNVPAETAAQQMGAPLDMVLAELEKSEYPEERK